MLRLVDVTVRTTTGITFQVTDDIDLDDTMVYVVYDTSTGVSTVVQEDYLGFRTTAVETSTGSGIYEFTISNTNKYPSYSDDISDFTILKPKLFRVMSLQEYLILQDVLIRFDLVRKRLPNPGVTVQGTDGVGEAGAVSFVGGYEKKMTVGEIMTKIEGTILELNGTPPRTSFWPLFQTLEADKINNPFYRSGGIPLDMMELIKLGTLIRCLTALGILEIDISFSSSDSGLQLTFDRAGQIKGWADSMLADYKEMKTLFKWNHANHAGIAVGTNSFMGLGIYGTLMNNLSSGGALALNSVLGFSGRGSTQL